jgi:hypothetical protein
VLLSVVITCVCVSILLWEPDDTNPFVDNQQHNERHVSTIESPQVQLCKGEIVERCVSLAVAVSLLNRFHS